MDAFLRSFATCALACAAALTACRPGDNAGKAGSGDSMSATNPAAGSLEGPTRRDSAGGMPGMPGGQMGGMMGAGMMDSMQTQMGRMRGMSAEQMRAMLPAHRQMVANMLSRMNQEMRSMNMPADAAWSATVDSIRQDLVHMPEMSGQELEAMMPGHRARVTRLIQMHRAMSKQMMR